MDGLGKFIERKIAQKFGVDTEIKVHNVKATMIDGEGYIRLEIEAKTDVNKIFEMLTGMNSVPKLERRGPK